MCVYLLLGLVNMLFHLCSNGNRALNRNAELPYLKEKSEIERELLVALFTARTFEPFELPERTTKAEKKPRAFRHVVAAPPDDSNLKRKTTSIDSEQHNKHGMHLYQYCGKLHSVSTVFFLSDCLYTVWLLKI